MAQCSSAMDSAFYPTLDQELLTTTFEEGSSASNVEGLLGNLLNQNTKNITTLKDRMFLHKAAARTLRRLISAWRLLPGLGEKNEFGEITTKFDYGYTAFQSLGSKYGELGSLEYQITSCVIGEFKKFRKPTAGVLTEVTNAVSKAYLQLMQAIDTEDGGKEVDIGSEDPVTAAIYTAVLNHPRGERIAGKRKRKMIDAIETLATVSGVDLGETLAATDYALSDMNDDLNMLPDTQGEEAAVVAKGTVAPKWLPKSDTSTSALIQRPKKSSRIGPPSLEKSGFSSNKKCKGSGNFGHGSFTKWLPNEERWVLGRIRADPYIAWSSLVKEINDKFQGEHYVHPKGGLALHMGRSYQAVRQRFKDYRQRFQQIRESTEPKTFSTKEKEREQDSRRGNKAIEEEIIHENTRSEADADSDWASLQDPNDPSFDNVLVYITPAEEL